MCVRWAWVDGVSVINVYRRGLQVYVPLHRTPRLGGYQWAYFLVAASIISMLACGVAILHVVNSAQDTALIGALTD